MQNQAIQEPGIRCTIENSQKCQCEQGDDATGIGQLDLPEDMVDDKQERRRLKNTPFF